MVNLVENDKTDLEIIAPGHKIVLDKLRNSDLIEHDLGHGLTKKQFMERGTVLIEGIEEEDYRPQSSFEENNYQLVNKLTQSGNIMIKDTSDAATGSKKFASTKNFIEMVDDLHSIIDSNNNF